MVVFKYINKHSFMPGIVLIDGLLSRYPIFYNVIKGLYGSIRMGHDNQPTSLLLIYIYQYTDSSCIVYIFT
jgi:hypothetical protein